MRDTHLGCRFAVFRAALVGWGDALLGLAELQDGETAALSTADAARCFEGALAVGPSPEAEAGLARCANRRP